MNFTAGGNLFVLEKAKEGTYSKKTPYRLAIDNADRLCIFSLSEMPQIIEKLKPLLHIGLDFFNNFGSIDGIDKMYNADPYSVDLPYCLYYSQKALNGIIAAKLNQNPAYPMLKKLYEETLILKGFSEERTIEPYRRIVAYLDTLP